MWGILISMGIAIVGWHFVLSALIADPALLTLGAGIILLNVSMWVLQLGMKKG